MLADFFRSDQSHALAGRKSITGTLHRISAALFPGEVVPVAAACLAALKLAAAGQHNAARISDETCRFPAASQTDEGRAEGSCKVNNT